MLLSVYTPGGDPVDVVYVHEEHHLFDANFAYVFCELIFLPWSSSDEVVLYLNTDLQKTAGALSAFQRGASYHQLTSHLLRRFSTADAAERTIHTYQWSFAPLQDLPINTNYSSGDIYLRSNRPPTENESAVRAAEFIIQSSTKYRRFDAEYEEDVESQTASSDIDSGRIYGWLGTDVEVRSDNQIDPHVMKPAASPAVATTVYVKAKTRPWQPGVAYGLRFGLFTHRTRPELKLSAPTFMRRVPIIRWPLRALRDAASGILLGPFERYDVHVFTEATKDDLKVLPKSRLWLFCSSINWTKPIIDAIRVAINSGQDPKDLEVDTSLTYQHSSIWIVLPSRLNIRRMWLVDRAEWMDDHFHYFGPAAWLMVWRSPPLQQLTLYQWEADRTMSSLQPFQMGPKQLLVRFYIQHRRLNALRHFLFLTSSAGIGAMAALILRTLVGVSGSGLLALGLAIWMLAALVLYATSNFLASTWADEYAKESAL